MASNKKKTYDRGLMAERIAAAYLWLKGYKILEMRYKTKVGEVDIIARKSSLIAFIEVKARLNKETALESVTPKMRQRITRAAKDYIAHHNCENRDMRFDLITVTPPFFIHHLKNAWLDI